MTTKEYPTRAMGAGAAPAKMSEPAAAEPQKGAEPEGGQVMGRRVLAVRDGRSIAWPDGTLRGLGRGPRKGAAPRPPYYIWSDDQHARGYEHNLRELNPGETGTPAGEADWPPSLKRAAEAKRIAELKRKKAD